jgi:hypothetical protein
MSRLWPLARAVALLATWGAWVVPSVWGGEAEIIDGVEYVHNGAQPRDGRQTVHLEEIWRIGGENDDALFGLITQVCHDEAGNIYILDSQLCEVRVYAPDGRKLKTLFRQGEGPGEVVQPRNLALLGDGSVGVLREVPGTLIRVDRDNNPLDNVQVHKPGRQGLIILDGCFAGGSTLAFSGTHILRTEQNIQERVNLLGIFSLAGDEIARLAEEPNRRDYTNFVLSERKELPAFFWATCVGPDGRVYTAPDRDRYAIKVFSPEGQLTRVIEREYEPYRRSAEEQQRLHDAFELIVRGADIEIGIEIEEYEYTIATMQHGVRVREDNTLWVLPGRGLRDQPPGVMLTFDVFDPTGRFVKQVSYACPGNGVWDGFFFVGSDRVVVVTGHVEAVLAQYGSGTSSYDDGQTASMEVICYRIAG